MRSSIRLPNVISLVEFSKIHINSWCLIYTFINLSSVTTYITSMNEIFLLYNFCTFDVLFNEIYNHFQ